MGIAMLGHRLGLQPRSAPSAPCCSASPSSSSAPAWPARQDTVGGIVAFRALWGLGNALFIATALATIVNAASRLGGAGDHPLRGRPRRRHRDRPAARRLARRASPGAGPFFGVAALMAIALVATADDCCPSTPPAARADLARRAAPGAAPPRPAHRRLTALLYNFGFFTLLAFTPFPLAMGAAPDRVHLLRLGPAARLHLGGRRPAAAAPLRHPARRRRRPRSASPPSSSAMAIVHRQQGRPRRRRRPRRRLPRRQQHPHHRDGHEGRARSSAASPRRPTASSASAAAPSPPGWPASSARSRSTCRSGSAPSPSSSPSLVLAHGPPHHQRTRRGARPRRRGRRTTRLEAEALTVGDA